MGTHIAFKINILERAKQPRPPRSLPCYVRRKRLHIRAHERHIGMVDAECNVERIVERIDGAIDKRLAPGLMGYRRVESDAACLGVPAAFHKRIAKHHLVVAYILDRKSRSLDHRL